LTDYPHFNKLMDVVSILGHGKFFSSDVNRDKSRSRRASIELVNKYINANGQPEHLFLSAYTKQVMVAQSIGIHSNTIRPAQGTEAEVVF